jgi:hypothetical protein
MRKIGPRQAAVINGVQEVGLTHAVGPTDARDPVKRKLSRIIVLEAGQ